MPEQRARAALALTRTECVDPKLQPLQRAQVDQWRAEVLERVDAAGLRRGTERSTCAQELHRKGLIIVINTSTTLILGAGASKPFGLPTGVELKQMIYNALSVSDTHGGTFLDLFMGGGFNREQGRKFSNEFLRSGHESIDAFIAYRPEYAAIGVRAIAAVLLPMEREINLYSCNGWVGDSDWMQYLWRQLTRDCESAADIPKNNVRFLTFNYDRSLEVFILNALRNGYGLSESEAAEVLGTIWIHHFYGSLGEYADDGSGFAYGDATHERVTTATQLLKTMPSTRPESDEVAVEMIRLADQIICLGFGFDS